MLSFLLTSLIRYNEKSPISKKIKALYHSETEIIILEIEFYKGAKRLRGEQESGRNDSGGERESGRNDQGAKRLGANGKMGETTQGRTGKCAKRPGFTTRVVRVCMG